LKKSTFPKNLMVRVSVVVPLNFDHFLEDLHHRDPEWTIWDGRGKSWNWFYFDLTGPFHPPGLWGPPDRIRRGEFDSNFSLDPETLIQMAEEMWVELYDELIWYYPTLSDDLLDAHKSCQVHRHSNGPGSGLLPYLDVALFLYIVGSSQNSLTWVFERP
jgi:hypothetical protein